MVSAASQVRIAILSPTRLPKMAAKIQTVPEAVAAGLQTLRNEQRQLANKLSELQMDLNEHK